MTHKDCDSESHDIGIKTGLGFKRDRREIATSFNMSIVSCQVGD